MNSKGENKKEKLRSAAGCIQQECISPIHNAVFAIAPKVYRAGRDQGKGGQERNNSCFKEEESTSAPVSSEPHSPKLVLEFAYANQKQLKKPVQGFTSSIQKQHT